MKDEQDRIRRENNEKELSDLVKKGINIGDVDVTDLDSNQLRLLRISQLEKEKDSLSKNLRVTGKRIDHLERAFRKEEVKLLSKDYDAQRERDLAAYEKSKEENLREAERKHKEDVALKHRLSRLLPKYEEFTKDLKERRHDEFEKRRKAADREFQNAVERRKREARERKARERREREEAERRAQEEEERIAREAEEAEAAAAEKKRLAAEAKAKRDAERRYVVPLPSVPHSSLINELGSLTKKPPFNGRRKKKRKPNLQPREQASDPAFQTAPHPFAALPPKWLALTLMIAHLAHLALPSPVANQHGENVKPQRKQLKLLVAPQRLLIHPLTSPLMKLHCPRRPATSHLRVVAPTEALLLLHVAVLTLAHNVHPWTELTAQAKSRRPDGAQVLAAGIWAGTTRLRTALLLASCRA